MKQEEKLNILEINYYKFKALIGTFFLIIILVVSYFILGKLSFHFLADKSIISIGLFPAEGVALAFVLLFGKRIIPGIFLGQLFLAYFNGISILAAVFIAFTNSFEALFASLILQRFNFHKSLEDFRDYGVLFATIIFVLQPWSATVSNLILLYFEHIQQKDFFHLLLSWGFGNALGQLLITPFLLLLTRSYDKQELPSYISQSLIIGVLFYLLLIEYDLHNPFLLFCIILPIIISIVVIKNTLHGMFLVVVVSFITAYSLFSGHGAFSTGSSFTNVVNFDLFILSMIIIVVGVGVLFEQRRKVELLLNERVKSAVSKIRVHELTLIEQNRFVQMGEMIAMIAHQWRQPLNNLSLLVQSLGIKYKKNQIDKKYFQFFQENAIETITYMSQTIDDFRDFFKPQKEKHCFELKELVEYVVSLQNTILKQNAITFTYQVIENVEIYGYKNELGQAILNILNNAKDALVQKVNKNRTITLSVTKEEKNLIIGIEDNAGGIAPEIITNIFDPYFSTKNTQNGTGLGLYMTKIIIEEHSGGKLQLHNTQKGAKFEIILPLNPEMHKCKD